MQGREKWRYVFMKQIYSRNTNNALHQSRMKAQKQLFVYKYVTNSGAENITDQ